MLRWVALASLAVVAGGIATVLTLQGADPVATESPIDAGTTATQPSQAIDAALAVAMKPVDAAPIAQMVVIETTQGAEIREKTRRGPLVARTRYELPRPAKGERLVFWLSKHNHVAQSVVVTPTTPSTLRLELEPKLATRTTKTDSKTDTKTDTTPVDPGAIR